MQQERDERPTRVGTHKLVLGEERATWALVEADRPPCNAACPAGVNAKAYVALIAEGRFDHALRVVRERIPFPGVIGRVCSRPCESECVRAQFDDPISICSLKRFIADYELRLGGRIVKRIRPERPERVAIIGAGPAGLTAAQDLLLRGFGVTVYDRFEQPGGMLLAGIPSFRLPRDILALEADEILKMGVELKAGVCVGHDIGIEGLLGQGYKAALIATGAHKGISLGVEGDELDGVYDAISFLASVNLDGNRSIGSRVIVIGGGDSAIDSARTALRLGAREVRIAYRRSRAEMPARDYEIDEAVSEGVEIDFLVAPTRIFGAGGKVSSIELTRMRLGEPDSSGRRRPIPEEGSEFEVECDSVIAALGQRPDLSFLEGQRGIEATRWGTILADERTCATSLPGVFAAGDVVSGAATAVEAIGAAHRAAEAIASFIESGAAEVSLQRELQFPVKFEMIYAPSVPQKRIEPPSADAAESARSFDEVEMAYTVQQAREEASRCLMCGSCTECELCINACDGRYVAVLSQDVAREACWGDGDLTKIQRPALEELLADCEAPISGAIEAADGSIRQGGILTPILAVVNEDLCIGCGICSEVCSFTAARIACRMDGTVVSILDSTLCRGCGSCVANCPTGALDQTHFSSESLATAALDAKGVLVLACLWGKTRHPESYRALTEPADFATVALRVTSAELGEATLVELLCAGRIPAWLLLKAIERGVDRIVVAGCGADDCRYGSGKDIQETVSAVRALLEMLGMPPDKIDFVELRHND
ncbi:MAG: FAD-dependent oxidoreductase [Candidatus Coatesbacteria bacterium]|nr:FAD-dependent oxidoreductase [Candidatus Coatesbacteria bacterium]